MKGKKVSSEMAQQIKLLRTQGYSLPEISKAVLISKTTVLRYIQGVEILPEFMDNWAGKRGGSRKRKILQEKLAFEEGRKVVSTLSQREKMFFLAALYWGEGSKRDFGLSNTDPELIRVFINGLREVFGVTNDRIRVSVRIYEDLDKDKCLSFWSGIVNIPKEKFLETDVLQGKKQGKLVYGMCRIRVTKGAELLKHIMGLNRAMAAYLSS